MGSLLNRKIPWTSNCNSTGKGNRAAGSSSVATKKQVFIHFFFDIHTQWIAWRNREKGNDDAKAAAADEKRFSFSAYAHLSLRLWVNQIKISLIYIFLWWRWREGRTRMMTVFPAHSHSSIYFAKRREYLVENEAGERWKSKCRGTHRKQLHFF